LMLQQPQSQLAKSLEYGLDRDRDYRYYSYRDRDQSRNKTQVGRSQSMSRFQSSTKKSSSMTTTTLSVPPAYKKKSKYFVNDSGTLGGGGGALMHMNSWPTLDVGRTTYPAFQDPDFFLEGMPVSRMPPYLGLADPFSTSTFGAGDDGTSGGVGVVDLAAGMRSLQLDVAAVVRGENKVKRPEASM